MFKALFQVIGALVVFGVIFVALNVGTHEAGKRTMDRIDRDVAKDFVHQYEILQRNNDVMGMCVHAGVVAEAYLQAKDEAQYRHWKAVEKKDCKRAGMP